MPDAPYRATQPPSPDPYAKAWADLRRRRRLVPIAHAPSVAGFVVTLATQSSGAFLVSAGLFLLGWVATMHEGGFRCPNCGNHFKRSVERGRLRLGFARPRCWHCGIPIGTPLSAVAPPAA